MAFECLSITWDINQVKECVKHFGLEIAVIRIAGKELNKEWIEKRVNELMKEEKFKFVSDSFNTDVEKDFEKHVA